MESECFFLFLSSKIPLTFLKQVGGETAAGKAGEASALSGRHLSGVTRAGCVSLNQLLCSGNWRLMLPSCKTHILEDSSALSPVSPYLNDTFFSSLHPKASTAWGNLIIFSSLGNNDKGNDSKYLLNVFAYVNTYNPHHNP